MANAKAQAKYEKKRLDVIKKLKDKGGLIQIKGTTLSGDPYDQVETPVLNDHYALSLELESGDIFGNVSSRANKWMVDASNVISDDMKLVSNGVNEDIKRLKPLNPSGDKVIFYEVFTER